MPSFHQEPASPGKEHSTPPRHARLRSRRRSSCLVFPLEDVADAGRQPVGPESPGTPLIEIGIDPFCAATKQGPRELSRHGQQTQATLGAAAQAPAAPVPTAAASNGAPYLRSVA